MKIDLTLDELIAKDEHVSVLNESRTYRQFLSMCQMAMTGTCPFCPENLDPQLNKIIFNIEGWRCWENPFPIKHTRRHVILSPERHVTHLDQLTERENKLRAYVINDVLCSEVGADILSGAIVTRFGKSRFNAGSVSHLHTNIIMPDETGEVRITLAKTELDMVIVRQRLEVFYRLMQMGFTETITMEQIDFLTKHEIALIVGRLK